MKPIQTITAENFAPFGKVLCFPENPADPRYMVIVEEEVQPWCIATFCVRIKEANRLECHPTSKESFTPIRGTGLLLIAAPETPQDYHVFLLDKSVCLNKGVWHEIITISDEAEYQITENLKVHSEFYNFDAPVGAVITNLENK